MSSDPSARLVSTDIQTASPTDVVISVKNAAKCYQIYERPQDRLKQSVMPRLNRLVGATPRKYFREFWALRDVSFEIRRGETVGIIGRNGSGKSTLLQILCGTLTPTSGQVEVVGRVGALLELGSGFNPEFTGRENVYMSGMVLGLTQEQVAERYNDILEFADIGEFIEQPVKTYSSGMYVRLAFAVIAHADADILVIDEALSVGDVFFGQKCMRFLRNFQQKGTVLFVSHDASAVTNLCDRAIMLESGQVKMSGPAKTVCEAYHASGYTGQGAIARKRESADSLAIVAPAAANGDADATGFDMRSRYLHVPPLRNDIEVFRFNPDSAGFGDGRARIVSVQIADETDGVLSWVVGGERVKLTVTAQLEDAMASPIIGFSFKDKLGQVLFGENTYLSYADAPFESPAAVSLQGIFDFAMPILPPGHYSIDVAIADGSYVEHSQADWIHDALVLESHSSSVSTGLVGIPFNDIRLRLLERSD